MIENPHAHLAALDLSDPGLYESGAHVATFDFLRRNIPVFWNQEQNGPGFWAVTTYAGAVSVYRDPSSFSSQRGIILGSHRWSGDPASGKMLALTDPPRHGKLREVMAQAFTPKTVARLEARLREMIGRLVTHALELGTCDLVDVIAAPIPVAAVSEILGVPEADRDWLVKLTRIAFGSADSEYAVGGSARAAAGEAHSEILAYYLDLVAAKRKAPGDDMVSALALAVIDGQPLTAEEIVLNCDNLTVGGNETARHAVAGGLLALIERPDQWSLLKRNHALMGSAIEEILRWTSPAMHVLRTTTREVVIEGQPMQGGADVVVWNISANRDATAFPNANSFEIMRTPNRHIAFGIGEHYCIGASLTRLELRMALEQVSTRIQVDLAGRVQPLRSNLVHGLKHMPVRVTAFPPSN
jgi:cytochrome P450